MRHRQICGRRLPRAFRPSQWHILGLPQRKGRVILLLWAWGPGFSRWVVFSFPVGRANRAPPAHSARTHWWPGFDHSGAPAPSPRSACGHDHGANIGADIYPAVSVIDELLACGIKNEDIYYLGNPKNLEYEIAKKKTFYAKVKKSKK